MTDTFTAIDLSRLPAPDVVEQLSFEAIVAAMLADLQARDPSFTALVESDPAYKILEVAAYRETLVRAKVNSAAHAVMLAYAGGADLDQLGARDNVARLELTPADPETGTPAVMESDVDFRRRIQLAPEGFSVAGPEGAYHFHSLKAHPDVLDVSATSPDPGEVVITILSRQGDGTAAAPVLEAVEAALDDGVRPLTDHVTVQSAEILEFEIEATIKTFSGPTPEAVLTLALDRLDAYLAESRRLGRDVVRSGIIGALHAPQVQRVVLTSPAADIVATRLQAAYCTDIDVTLDGVGE